MESGRGATGGRERKLSPGDCGGKASAGGQGRPERYSPAGRGTRAHRGPPGRTWGVGTPAAAVPGAGGEKSPTWRAPPAPGL